MNVKTEKPKNRSPLRKWLGIKFYTLRRFVKWHTDGENYAKKRTNEDLPQILCSHATPLLRNLKNAHMELQYNKITNLKLAVERLNGIVLQPGELFSYWRLMGKPTAKKGYLTGIVLDSGKITEGVGGGLCQLFQFNLLDELAHGFDRN